MNGEHINRDAGNDIVIVLNDSTYAHAFGEGNRIHQHEYEKAIRLIDGQITMFAAYSAKESVLHDRFHNTISVFGGRGTGKTSFLHSILDHYGQQQVTGKSIEVLGIIDPTILEEKGHIFLYIVSLINKRVCKVLDAKGCSPTSEAFMVRKDWETALSKLAQGLPSLDAVGSDYRNASWQDDDFIMEKGLVQVDAALNLELSFHRLVDKALHIIGKDCFMLAFDDIDVDMKKGWPILECIRKYLTTPRIITLLSGNLRFYSNNIRIRQWKQLELLVKYEADDGSDKFMMGKFNAQVNEIEGQYLIKVLKAENRIHLHSLHEAIQTYNRRYFVKYTEGTERIFAVEDKYTELLNRRGIENVSSVEIFLKYMLGLSLRTQINILQNDLHESIGEAHGIASVDTFLSRMYAAKIDIDLMINNPWMCNIPILDYLVRYNILNNSYLLLPTDDNEGINACVTGLTFLFMEKQRCVPYLIFDYMLRIGYVRNVLLASNSNDILSGMCSYAGAFQDVSLKNFVGMSMGYLASHKEYYDLKEHALVYGLSAYAREGHREDLVRIDDAFSADGVTAAQKTIGFIPLCALKYSGKNESRLYYSIFNLLAAIGQVLKVASGRDTIRTELDKMQLLRYYSILDNNAKASGLEDVFNFSENNGDDGDDNSMDNLVSSLEAWVHRFEGQTIPPYALGRIVSRLYSTTSQIRARNLGAKMYQYTVTLLNACLIEEALELQGEHDVPRLNNSNATNSDRIFLNNLGKISDAGLGDRIWFTKWLAECPLIQAFFDANFWERNRTGIIERNGDFEKISVYEILDRVGTRPQRTIQTR